MSDYSGRITHILAELEDAFDGIATIGRSSTFQREHATYGEAYLKVGYQLGTALLASKEILLVLADFPEVQTRTLRVAHDRLEGGGDRLQKGVIILAHRDPTGDSKLRNWGREQGLTVLPLDYSDAVPQGEGLLDRLLEDLYSYDRFDLTGPVRSEYQFFGRPFIPDLARRLREGTIHALFGMRKIGKTSLLNRVLGELQRQGCRCVVLDASDDSLSNLAPGELLSTIRVAVEHVTTGTESYTSVSGSEAQIGAAVASEAQALLDALSRSGEPVILFIDEVDYLTPSSPVSRLWMTEFNVFFRALRRVYQEATRREPVFSIVISGVSSRWFTTESIDGVENAALAMVPEGYLAPLERSESMGMVETLGRACGLVMTPQGLDLVAHYASDNPFWIRKLGSFINSCFGRERPVRIETKAIHTLCEEFLEVEGTSLAYSSLRHLFRIYPDLGFAAIGAVVGQRKNLNQPLLSLLGRYGIIAADLEASGPMITAGLARWRTEDSVHARELELLPAPGAAEVIAAGSPSSAGEEEWARMLSEVSLHRNTQEKRLRELMLVVIRSECANDSQRKPAEVVLAGLPAERRTDLQGLSAGQLIKRLYWLDVLQIIRKNWRWFETLFGDRSKFDMWGDIVNDRPDTHAKDLDGAELALQRRAIDWFAQAIDRSELL